MTNAIWDFDGTLFNTYPYMVTAFCKALYENGISDIDVDSDDIYEQMRIHDLGTAKSKYAARLGIDRSFLSGSYRKFEADEVKLAKPFPGVSDALEAVIETGGVNGLLTHRDDAAVELLKKFGIKKLFVGFVTSKQSFKRKPNPASLNYLIEKLHLKRSETFMIGDRKLDIEAGHNANVKTILFDPDYLIKDDGNPDDIARSMRKITDLIKVS